MDEADTVVHTCFGVSRVYILFFFFQLPNEDMTNFHVMNSKRPFPLRILAQEESARQATLDFLALCILRCQRKGLTTLN